MLVLSACAGPRNFLNENDRLREENLGLRDRVDALSQQVGGLQNQLEAKKQETEAGQRLPEGVYRPTATNVSIDQYSGGVSTDDDPASEAIRLYLPTTDRRGRFVQTIATVRVSAVAIRPGEEAKTVATAKFDAQAVDDAYRAGITGTHYSLTVPVDAAAVPPNTKELTVRVAVKDLVTGRTLEAEKTVPWAAPPADEKAESAGPS